MNTMGLKPGISVVIPVYNGESTIAELANDLERVLASCCLDFEAILVNDGSSDNSWSVIHNLTQQRDWIIGINLMRNFGQHNALLCGIRSARYDTTITMDDDLQNPPSEIPSLLAKLREGYDVVYGTPNVQRHGIWRDLASVMTKKVLKSIIGVETGSIVSAYRAFRTELRNAFTDFHEPFVSIDVLLSWATTKFAAVAVDHQERSEGASNYSLSKLVSHTFNMLTGFTAKPLRLASVIGFFFTLVGVGVLAFVLFKYFTAGTTVAGFPFLASIIAIFSGAQLFTLGVIGEYLARVYFHTMNKPTYVVKEKIVRNE